MTLSRSRLTEAMQVEDPLMESEEVRVKQADATAGKKQDEDGQMVEHCSRS